MGTGVRGRWLHRVNVTRRRAARWIRGCDRHDVKPVLAS